MQRSIPGTKHLPGEWLWAATIHPRHEAPTVLLTKLNKFLAFGAAKKQLQGKEGVAPRPHTLLTSPASHACARIGVCIQVDPQAQAPVRLYMYGLLKWGLGFQLAPHLMRSPIPLRPQRCGWHLANTDKPNPPNAPQETHRSLTLRGRRSTSGIAMRVLPHRDRRVTRRCAHDQLLKQVLAAVASNRGEEAHPH